MKVRVTVELTNTRVKVYFAEAPMDVAAAVLDAANEIAKHYVRGGGLGQLDVQVVVVP